MMIACCIDVMEIFEIHHARQMPPASAAEFFDLPRAERIRLVFAAIHERHFAEMQGRAQVRAQA